MKELFLYIIIFLEGVGCRYEVHSFESGAIMIDVWVSNNFYVIQVEEKIVGLSLITVENPGFDTKPDKSFTNADIFKSELQSIFK